MKVFKLLLLLITCNSLGCDVKGSREFNALRLQKDINVFLDSTRYDIDVTQIALNDSKTNIDITIRNNATKSIFFNDNVMLQNISEFLFYKFLKTSFISPLQGVSFYYEESGVQITKIEFTKEYCSKIISKYEVNNYYLSVNYIFKNVRHTLLYSYEVALEYNDLWLEIPPEDDFFVSLSKIDSKELVPDNYNISMLRLLLLYDFLKIKQENDGCFHLIQIFKLNDLNYEFEQRETYFKRVEDIRDSLGLKDIFNKDSSLVRRRLELS